MCILCYFMLFDAVLLSFSPFQESLIGSKLDAGDIEHTDIGMCPMLTRLYALSIFHQTVFHK